MMKRYFDFVIDKWEGFDKKVLRLYTKHSSVHGFDDNPPKTWNSVYKTYMTFSILRYWEDDDNEGKYERPYELFTYDCDEGDGLLNLREVLKDIMDGSKQKEYTIMPFGDGIDWEISNTQNSKEYRFTMINSKSGQCYRFRLTPDEIKEFYNVLNSFLEYMLKHSVGI